jgi:uncharacterized protein with ParB-like and HNH nuclease domain
MNTNNIASIESDDLNINDLFKDFYSVPDFQREYVWESSNVEKLLQDVYDEFYDEQNNQIQNTEYFIGSVVVCRDGEGAFQLIDGQQRLTTIYLSLCTIRDYLYELEATTPDTLKNQIGAASMNPQTGEDVFRYRLNLQYEDSDGVMTKIAKEDESINEIKETTESVKHILTAYRTIKEFLRINFNDNTAQVKKFLAAFIHRVKLIRIITPDLTHALKVFETINDRGVGLNAMDLLKNLLFMKTVSADYPKLKERWKSLIDTLDRCREKPLRYLRYYIMSQYVIEGSKPLREDEIYQWFVDNAAAIKIDQNPLEFVEDLVARSNDYANFAEKKDTFGVPNHYLNNISLLSGAARQHFILLLAGHHLPQNLFNELCRTIENLFFTYIVTRETTKQFERNFSKWASELRDVTDKNGLSEFIARNFIPDLKSRSNAFNFAFEELTQSRIQQYRLRYILAKLTQFIEQQAWGNPEFANLDQYVNKSVEIEHILPQLPTTELQQSFDKSDEYDVYKEKLGNLTLLEKTINASISRNPFEKKKNGYLESKFLLTTSLVRKPQVGVNTQLNRAVDELIQFEEWNSETIELRQQMLADLARKVWEIPD